MLVETSKNLDYKNKEIGKTSSFDNFIDREKSKCDFSSEVEGRVIVRKVGNLSCLLIDAESGIMIKIRGLFPKSRYSQEVGCFTNKPMVVYPSNENCRDIVWIKERFNLYIEPELLKLIEGLSENHKIQKTKIRELLIDRKFDKFIYKSKGDLKLKGIESRDYQEIIPIFAREINSNFILADDMGLGKTTMACYLLALSEWRRSILVVPITITSQWKSEINRILPDLNVFITKTTRCKIPDGTDIVITNYSKLSGLADTLFDFNASSIIFDEIQDLRRKNTEKYSTAKKLSSSIKSVGMSGTPFQNYGAEFYNVMDLISPSCLGPESSFRDEWCENEKVKHPVQLHKHLTERGLMIRRTAKEAGILKPEPEISFVEINSDLDSLRSIKDVAQKLALTVMGADAIASGNASREFSYKLRQATGIAKAKSVAEFTANIVENGEKVILCGWHREFWDICKKHFDSKGISYRMVTGEERTANAKDQSIADFKNDEADVLCVSHRSGAGIDGLQYCCRVLVYGELDWSKASMKQLIDRIARPGQLKQVLIYFLTVTDGSDPSLLEMISAKDAQFKGIIEGLESNEPTSFTESSDLGREFVQSMAIKYLESIGVDYDQSEIHSEGAEILKKAISKCLFPTESEDKMQRALAEHLKSNLPSNWEIHREYKFSKISRFDFLIVSPEGKQFVIECKNNSKKRSAVYRQVRRYYEESGINEIFLVGPWNGINSFKIDSCDVIVIDTIKNAIKV